MRNLLGRLHDRSPHDLELIARWWEVEPGRRDRYAVAGLLYRTMTDPWAFAFAWEQLSPYERALLELLTTDGASRTNSELTSQLKVPAETVRGLINRLFRIGFLYVDQDDDGSAEPAETQEPRYFLPRELSHLTSRLQAERDEGIPAGLPVAALLERLNDGALADIAEHLGRQIIPAVAMRRDLIQHIAPRLADPDHIRDTVRSFNPTVARVWRWLLERPEPCISSELRATLGLSQAEVRLAAQTLARRGLLWRGYEEDGTLRLVVPDVLRRPRKSPERTAPGLVILPEGAIEPVEWVFPFAAPWDLLTVVRAASYGLLVRRRGALDGRPGALRRLAQILWQRNGDVPPTGYLPFLDFLATGLGLFEQDGRAVNTARMTGWTRQGFPRLSYDLLDVWTRATSWPEATERETLQIWGGDWPAFRRKLLERLGELSEGAWVTLESFASRFAAENPAALGSHFSAAMSHEAVQDTSDERRLAILKTAVEMTLRSACAWLGLIALSSSQRRTVFRLTETGAWLCGKRDDPPAEPELGAHPLTVQASFEILLPRPTPRHVWALSAFAETTRLDHVSTYQITRAGIERGMNAGLSTAQIVGFLEQQGEEPLPQNVVFEIESWARGFRRVLVRDSVLLDIDDSDACQRIAAALSEAGFKLETLPRDRLLVIGREGTDADELAAALEEQLRELGQTPLRPAH